MRIKCSGFDLHIDIVLIVCLKYIGTATAFEVSIRNVDTGTSFHLKNCTFFYFAGIRTRIPSRIRRIGISSCQKCSAIYRDFTVRSCYDHRTVCLVAGISIIAIFIFRTVTAGCIHPLLFRTPTFKSRSGSVDL